MITYLRMSSAWHKGDGPAQAPRSLIGDGEVVAGGQGLLEVPGHAFGPDLAVVAGEHSCLVEENSLWISHWSAPPLRRSRTTCDLGVPSLIPASRAMVTILSCRPAWVSRQVRPLLLSSSATGSGVKAFPG